MSTQMSPEEIGQILESIHKLDCAQVEVTVGDVRIVVRRDAASEPVPSSPATATALPVRPPAAASTAAATPAAAMPQPPPAAQPQHDPVAVWLEREAEGQAIVIRAPMLGTFYRAKAPGEPPFVEVDAAVKKGDTVGLVEAMKLFNSLRADCDGTVGAIFAANGEMVEYEQPMLALWEAMSIRGQACIAGAFEHPTRSAPDMSVAQLHAECARGALLDAGLSLRDVDGYFCAGDAPGLGPLNMADYLGLRCRHVDSTDTGGSSYLVHVAHAAQAIAAGKCDVALITLAGRPRSEGSSGMQSRSRGANVPDEPFELPFGAVTVNGYALVAARHMHDWGTTPAQLAAIKVAASTHAQHNPHAMLRQPVSLEEVLASPLVSDPLRRLDCCVVSDGGGALVVVRPEIARSLKQPVVSVRGAGEAVKGQNGGRVDLSFSAAAWSGRAAFEEAGVTPADIRYASIYDSFTITVLVQLEDLGFCAKGAGGRFVADGNLIAGVGSLPFNTDGGGLCNNHPANRGGMTKVIEAVRQLRGTAHPAVQVPGCTLALAQGIGGQLGGRHGSATLVLERL